MPRLDDLIREIHRRSLWQVLVVYVAGSWAVLAVVDTLAGALGLPDWAPRLALFLLVIGLPMVLATAIVQEGVGPGREPPGDDGPGQAGDGHVEHDSTDAAEPPLARRLPHRIFTWRNAISGGVLAFALFGMVAAVYLVVSGPTALGSSSRVAAASAAGEGGTEPVGYLVLNTDPDALVVSAIAVAASPESSAPVELGRTPIGPVALSPGEYLLLIGEEGSARLSLLVEVEAGDTATASPTLAPDIDGLRNMVVVPGGPNPVDPSAQPVDAFLLDRTEVTNRMYAEFIAGGGYADFSLWPTTMIVGGDVLPRKEALSRLTDRTGQAGPREWSGGVHPSGQGEHPVVGVTWYEARAYARWAGKELPRWEQWWRAALGDHRRSYPWGDDVESVDRRANFGGDESAEVGAFPFGVSPFGAADLAGNVREWLLDAPGAPADRRVAVGGSWRDPSYSLDPSLVDAFPPSYASDVVGFRCARALPQSDSPEP